MFPSHDRRGIQNVFSNVYKNDQKIVFSQRIHNDNASYENPSHDLRINNKQAKYTTQYQWDVEANNIGLNLSIDLMNVPNNMRQDGLGSKFGGFYPANKFGRTFFETAGFYYGDYDSYQNALDDVNEFYSATPPPDAPHTPQE